MKKNTGTTKKAVAKAEMLGKAAGKTVMAGDGETFEKAVAKAEMLGKTAQKVAAESLKK